VTEKEARQMLVVKYGLDPDMNMHEMEILCFRIFSRMEKEGVAIDVGTLETSIKEMEQEFDTRLQEKIVPVIGDVNPGSPVKLGEALFGEGGLGLPVLRKTPKGTPSTSVEVLEKLKDRHEVIQHIIDYKHQSKHISYGKRLLTDTKEGRVYPKWNQFAAPTGRVYASDPNIQQMPPVVRKAIVPDEGHVFVSGDWDNQELRILMAESGQYDMVREMNSGLDGHVMTAARVFGKDPSEVTKEERTKAKTVNFGLLYGMTAGGLAAKMGLTEETAKQFYKDYFDKLPEVKRWKGLIENEMKVTGGVVTLLGRFRDLRGEMESDMGKAIRQGVNTKIQGSAADMLKITLPIIEAGFSKRFYGESYKIVAVVHDSIMIQAKEEDQDKAVAFLRSKMYRFHVGAKMTATLSVGKSWGELVKVDA